MPVRPARASCTACTLHTAAVGPAVSSNWLSLAVTGFWCPSGLWWQMGDQPCSRLGPDGHIPVSGALSPDRQREHGLCRGWCCRAVYLLPGRACSSSVLPLWATNTSIVPKPHCSRDPGDSLLVCGLREVARHSLHGFFETGLIWIGNAYGVRASHDGPVCDVSDDLVMARRPGRAGQTPCGLDMLQAQWRRGQLPRPSTV